jgi:serine/threonine protein kinase
MGAQQPTQGDGSESSGESDAELGDKECWLLLEYCDMGSLVDAVVKGWFRTDRRPSQGEVDIRAVAMTAMEVASAVYLLHERNIVHGDLSGGNVLLTYSKTNLHGFRAKVADFGMAREMDVAQRMQINQYGTVTHMPPEMLLHGEISKAADIYSFGVLVWEMLTGTRAWAGLVHAQIMCQVALLHRRLAIPKDIPDELAELLRECMAPEPNDRPDIQQVVDKLSHFLQTTRDSKPTRDSKATENMVQPAAAA